MSIRFQTAVGTRDCDRRSNGRSNSCRVGKTNSTWKSRGLILSARQQVVGVRGAGLLDCPAARPRYYTSPPEENVICTQSVKRHSALPILVIRGVVRNIMFNPVGINSVVGPIYEFAGSPASSWAQCQKTRGSSHPCHPRSSRVYQRPAGLRSSSCKGASWF